LSYNKTHSFQGTGYEILGFIDDDPDKQNLQYMGTPVIGTRQNLLSLVKQLHVDEIVIAITNTGTMQPELFYSLLACREMGLAITSMPMVYESLTGRVSWNHAGQSFHVVLPQHQSSTKRLYLAARRLIDIAVSVPGCLFLLLVMPFVWLANRVVSPGPLFYSQERVGQNGRPFSIVKLRTMIVDAEKHTGAVWAAEKDPRITRLGHFLRKTRLDEIPQFWNIFKGEMSIIGPRPERPTFVDKLVVDYPFYRLRHAVKPGLTGWAQVKHRYTSTVADTLVKLQYDLYYIKHQNFFVDMQILLETVRVVLGFKGR
jgi:exopolysaccharide biosynthesis polyprenyl glycosylphosphotransferase